MDKNVEERNQKLLGMLSRYLNLAPDFITVDMVEQFMQDSHMSREESVSYLLAAALGMDLADCKEDLQIFHTYFPHMLHLLQRESFLSNPYYRKIRIPEKQLGNWRLGHMEYKPYEMFVCDDMKKNGAQLIPQIGYFTTPFSYPVVWEKDREWMMITPNEIQTMQPGIAAAHGKVATFGLGLGYYAFMVSEKSQVDSVTIVEKEPQIIELFSQVILPQFPQREKIRIVCQDAFVYAEQNLKMEAYDYVYVDLWHDVSDGMELYKHMKKLAKDVKDTAFGYWIEPTLQCYV